MYEPSRSKEQHESEAQDRQRTQDDHRNRSWAEFWPRYDNPAVPLLALARHEFRFPVEEASWTWSMSNCRPQTPASGLFSISWRDLEFRDRMKLTPGQGRCGQARRLISRLFRESRPCAPTASWMESIARNPRFEPSITLSFAYATNTKRNGQRSPPFSRPVSRSTYHPEANFEHGDLSLQ